VLKCADGDTSAPFLEGRQYLFALLQQLSQMRGSKSRYLQPLLSKTDPITIQMFSTFALTFNSDLTNRGGYLQVENEEADISGVTEIDNFLFCGSL
jgi:hypothetical protein